MSTIKRSKTDAFSVKESVNIVKLAEAAFEQVSLDQLTDVVVETPTDGDILVYSSDLMAWENVPQAGLNYDLEDLDNITITSVSDGQVLTWDSGTSKWVNETPTTGATNLDGLSDVTISTPSNGQVLKYNGSAWVNGTDSGATPGGSDTHVQYNDGGVLGGKSTFSFNETTDTLSIPKVNSSDGLYTLSASTLGFGSARIYDSGDEMGFIADAIDNLGIDTRAFRFNTASAAPEFYDGSTYRAVYHAGNLTAANTPYDNATSGLTSTDVQGAIDELNTVAGALANIRGTTWRSFDWVNATFYTRASFGSGFSTLDTNRRYASIECSASVSNSGGYISGSASTPPGNIAVLGPWANNWTGIVVFLPYQGANDVSTTAGLQDSSFGTATASLFGVEYSLANGWEIVFRYASADLQTRVPFTMASAENMTLEVYYETDAAQTVVELIRVTVREYPSGSVIATDTWTGSTAFTNLYWKLKAYKVGASSLREFLYSVLYMGDGFNPPPGLSFT